MIGVKINGGDAIRSIEALPMLGLTGSSASSSAISKSALEPVYGILL
jgi:hypothetical protein